jgi:site-specific DNA-adenine methylase
MYDLIFYIDDDATKVWKIIRNLTSEQKKDLEYVLNSLKSVIVYNWRESVMESERTLKYFLGKHCFLGNTVEDTEITFNHSSDIIKAVKEWLKEQDPEAPA